MSTKIQKLMFLGNQAKKVGKKCDYTLTNTIFASLLDYFFDWSFDSDEDGGKWRGGLFLASNDPKGSKPDIDGAYFDLLILVLEKWNVGLGKYVYVDCLTMPARLLEPVTLVHALKRAGVVDHGKYLAAEVAHNNTVSQLWHEFFSESGFFDKDPKQRFSMEEFKEQIEDVLHPETAGIVFREAEKFFALELMSQQAVA